MKRNVWLESKNWFIIPSPNTTMEPEFNQVVPEGVLVHAKSITSGEILLTKNVVAKYILLLQNYLVLIYFFISFIKILKKRAS